MEIVKYILLGIEFILCIALITLMLMQSEKGEGASGAISGGSSDGYFGKNMDRSKDAILRRITIIAGSLFMIVTFVLGLLYIA